MIHPSRRKIRLVKHYDFVAVKMNASVTQQHAIQITASPRSTY